MENFQDTFEVGKLSFINVCFNLHECTFNTLIGRLVPTVHPQQVTVTPNPLWTFLTPNSQYYPQTNEMSIPETS